MTDREGKEDDVRVDVDDGWGYRWDDQLAALIGAGAAAGFGVAIYADLPLEK